MKFFFNSLIMVLSLFVSCKPKFLPQNLTTIEIYDAEYGKQAFMHNELKLLSEITDIDKNNSGTSLYALYNKKRIEIPVNDGTFNYKVFGENLDAFKNRKAKLYVKKYIYHGKEFFLAFKIE